MIKRFRPVLLAVVLPAMIACAGEDKGDGAAHAESLSVAGTPAFQPKDWSLSGAVLAGRHAIEAGDDAMAAKLLGLALATEGGDLALASDALAATVGSGDFDGAVKLAAALKKAGAKSPLIPLVELVDQARRGDFKAARATLAELGDDNVAKVSKPLFGAWIAIGEGKDEKVALGELKALEGINGVGGLVVQHVALVRDLFGETAEGLKGLKQAADAGYGSARFIEMYADFLHRNNETDTARAYLAEIAGAESGVMAAMAEALLERLDQPPAKGPRIDNAADGLAAAFFDLASLLHSENVADRAKILARLALALRPDFDIGQLLLGNMMQERGRCADAIELYRAVPESSVLRWSAEVSVADCQQESEDVDGAIATLQGLVKQRPDRIEAIVQLGDLYRREKRFDDAISAYDQVIGDMTAPASRDWTLYYARGVAHERAKQWDKAEPDFKKALELSPEQPYVLNYLAYTWVERRENLDQALDMLHRAVDQRPEEGFIVDSLGWAYFQLGDFQKAVTYLERAVELQPTDPVLNDHLGDAYWRVGRKNEARFQWHRALSFKPEADLVPPIEEKLKTGLGKASNNTDASSDG